MTVAMIQGRHLRCAAGIDYPSRDLDPSRDRQGAVEDLAKSKAHPGVIKLLERPGKV
jgi:hypothetical protein